jgi:casein kinase 1
MGDDDNRPITLQINEKILDKPGYEHRVDEGQFKRLENPDQDIDNTEQIAR